jgi:hypothetical protein
VNKARGLSASLVAALVALVLTIGGNAPADEGTRSARDVAERAQAEPDHSALAERYEQEATALDAKADQHKELVRMYVELGYLKDKPELVSHCDALADKYRAAATESRSFAKLHMQLGNARSKR